MSNQCIGLIGCGLVGRRLALSMEKNGISVVIYDGDQQKVIEFAAGAAAGKNIFGVSCHHELMDSLQSPRCIMMALPAGAAVHQCISSILPYMDKEDTLIDCADSHFAETLRRTQFFEEKGLNYIGAGFPGQKKNHRLCRVARQGRGNKSSRYFEAICAKTEDGESSCDWVGSGGAGHFVKMIHDGIEYVDSQLICEAYHMMKTALDMSNEEMHEVFTEWNWGELDSHLIEITREILDYRNEAGEDVIDLILDTAEHKDTGRWAGIEAMNLGCPLSMLGRLFFARCLAAQKEERIANSKVLCGPNITRYEGNKESFINELRQALYASKIVNYAQAFHVLQAAEEQYGWELDCGGIAFMWRGGSTIRSVFLGKIKEAFDSEPGLCNVLAVPFFKEIISVAQKAWRDVIATAVILGIPMPAMTSALSYYDGCRSERLPANLLQAQSDYLGEHNYERIDRPGGQVFHTEWTKCCNVASV